MADDPVEYCAECGKGLSPGEIYIFSGNAYCITCIGAVSSRGEDWRE